MVPRFLAMKLLTKLYHVTQIILQVCSYEQQGRSQDLNRHLQNIVQNFDDDVIIIMLMSLS